MNTATSQFGRMPEWTIGAGAWGVWIVVMEPGWAGSWAHFKGWGGGLFCMQAMGWPWTRGYDPRRGTWKDRLHKSSLGEGH